MSDLCPQETDLPQSNWRKGDLIRNGLPKRHKSLPHARSSA